MKHPLLLLTFTILLFAARGLAQAPHADTARLRNDSTRLRDTAKVTAATAGATTDGSGEEGFHSFLIIYAVVFIGIVFAAILVGAAIMVGFLVVLFALVSAGVLSTSILVGMHRRSAAAGFRTLLVIVCGLAGLFTGAVGLWLVGNIFTLNWKAQTALLTGALGGLVGGMVLGLVLFFIFNSFFRYCKRRLAL